MGTINIEIDSRDLEILKASLEKYPKEALRALPNALNRGAIRARKLMAQEARKHYNITSAEVKNTIDIEKASPSKLEAKAISEDKMLKLSNFKFSYDNASTVRTPVTVAVKRGGKKLISSQPPVFYGKGDLFHRASATDRRVRLAMTLSIPQMISNEEVFQQIQREGNEYVHERLIHELEYRHALVFGSLF